MDDVDPQALLDVAQEAIKRRGSTDASSVLMFCHAVDVRRLAAALIEAREDAEKMWETFRAERDVANAALADRDVARAEAARYRLALTAVAGADFAGESVLTVIARAALSTEDPT